MLKIRGGRRESEQPNPRRPLMQGNARRIIWDDRTPFPAPYLAALVAGFKPRRSWPLDQHNAHLRRGPGNLIQHGALVPGFRIEQDKRLRRKFSHLFDQLSRIAIPLSTHERLRGTAKAVGESFRI